LSLMLREQGWARASGVWRQGPSILPNDVRAILAAADLAAERTAARVRFGVLILIGLVLVGLGSLAGVYSEWIATIFALNLGVSVATVVLARPAVFRSWVPWALATLDAAVVLGVMIFGDVAERISASYTPALAVSWVMFLLLALTAMRFKPALVLYLGGLLLAGLAAAMALDVRQAAVAPTDGVGQDHVDEPDDRSLIRRFLEVEDVGLAEGRLAVLDDLDYVTRLELDLLDQGRDRGGGGLGPLGQLADLLRDDREPAALLADPCRFDRRVQREQVRLIGDRVDHLDDVADPFRG